MGWRCRRGRRPGRRIECRRRPRPLRRSACSSVVRRIALRAAQMISPAHDAVGEVGPASAAPGAGSVEQLRPRSRSSSAPSRAWHPRQSAQGESVPSGHMTTPSTTDRVLPVQTIHSGPIPVRLTASPAATTRGRLHRGRHRRRPRVPRPNHPRCLPPVSGDRRTHDIARAPPARAASRPPDRTIPPVVWCRLHLATLISSCGNARPPGAVPEGPSDRSRGSFGTYGHVGLGPHGPSGEALRPCPSRPQTG